MPHRWVADSAGYQAVARQAGAVVLWSRASMVAALVVPLLVLLVIGVVTYRDAFDAARERLERAARIGQEHAARVVETNAVLARAMSSLAGDADDPALLARQAELHAELRRLTQGLAQIQSAWLWSADGRPLFSNRFAQVPAGLDISDREYFRWARNHAGDGWFVSRPLVSRSTGEPFVDFARRRSRADGGFAGVVSVSLFPVYFTRFYRELAEREPGLAVTLVRADGAVIARWPSPPRLDTALGSDSPLLARMREGVPSGETTGRSSIDGQQRQVSFRRIDGLDLYVAASLDRSTILADWTRQMAVLAGFVIPLSLALVYVTWLALRRAQREITAVQGFRAEVEQRLRAEDALRQAQKLEALGHLTGGVAHDFNNLLMVVNSNAHLLRRQLPGAADSRELAAIQRAVASGSKLTRQLLAFARRQPLQPAPIALPAALPDLLELVRTVAGRAVTVSATCAADVPPVEVDSAELEVALLNLAVNARDAMPEGGRLALLARRAEPAETGGRDLVALSVSDTGSGIPPELLARVFEPFFTTKQAGNGTGLGLAQVHGFAEQSGGFARIDSELGKGTTVTIYLPASTRTPPAREGERREPPSLAGRVLLVEDNAQIAEALLPLLRSFGCEVEHAADGDAALAAVEREPARFDAVLSDIVMPGATSGLVLGLALRQRHSELPVLLMTGYSAELHRALAEGFEVLPKPCEPGALADALGRALAHRRDLGRAREAAPA